MPGDLPRTEEQGRAVALVQGDHGDDHGQRQGRAREPLDQPAGQPLAQRHQSCGTAAPFHRQNVGRESFGLSCRELAESALSHRDRAALAKRRHRVCHSDVAVSCALPIVSETGEKEHGQNIHYALYDDITHSRNKDFTIIFEQHNTLVGI